MNIYAFVFARGGSKGLPGKNLKNLLGKPLLQYSIETALGVSRIDKVFVSTEDREIERAALDCGAIVIRRPPELASDTSPEWLSWQHAILWVKKKFGDFDGFVSLPTTSPLRFVSDVESAIDRWSDAQADICIGVTPSSRSPFFNMITEDSTGLSYLLSRPEAEVSRRQDAPDVFDITTVVYVARPVFVEENYGMFSGKVVNIKIPKERAVDIDDMLDFKFAETIMRERF